MKYIFYNDLDYLFQKRKNIIIMLLIIPLLVLPLNLMVGNALGILKMTMGLNILKNSSGIIEITMFLFNLSFTIFLAIDLYIKDIEYNLENIFLRLKPSSWWIKKTSLFMTMMLLLKIFQYSLLTFALIIFNIEIVTTNIVLLLVCDYLYIILLQFLFLLIYIISIIILRKKIMSLIIFITALFVLPKNIWELKNYLVYLIASVAIIQVLILFLFHKYNKKIIENI